MTADDYLRRVFRTSAHLVQWREKDLGASSSAPWITLGTQLARQTGKAFLVNTHVEAALAAGAQGAHLPSRASLPAALERRRRAGNERFLLGKSVHSVREAEVAEEQGADYVFLSPILEPSSKESAAAALGFNHLREASQILLVPIFALGGMSPRHEEILTHMNVAGFAGIGWLDEELGVVPSGTGF